MSNKNIFILKTIYLKDFIFLISLMFILSEQCGAQWQNTNFPSTSKVNTIIISDSNIFAGTDGDGIFLSKDNGDSWSGINEGLQSKVIHKIFINGSKLFAGTETGAYISTNYGAEWNSINSGLSGKGVWSFALGYFMGDTTIFAGTWSGVYKSTNFGTNWDTTGLSFTQMPVLSVVVLEPYVYAATFSSGVYKSPDYGNTWSNVEIDYPDKSTSKGEVIPVYSLSAIDTNIVAGAGNGDFYYTTGNSPKFTISAAIASKNKPVLCYASRNKSIFAGNTNGGICFSSSGIMWKAINPYLSGKPVYSLALNSSYIFAGTDNGIWRLPYPEATTGIEEIKEVPSGFALEQNYPNPFNSSTKIRFTITGSGNVSLKVYNILGEVVYKLIDNYLNAGTYETAFSPSNLESGIYFYSLVTQEFKCTKKLILLK
jgi:hypothetical protein